MPWELKAILQTALKWAFPTKWQGSFHPGIAAY